MRRPMAVMLAGVVTMGWVPVVAAQGAAGAMVPPATPPARLVVPGDTSLRPGLVQADSLTYALTGMRNGQVIPVGTITDVIAREGGTATPVLRRAMIVQRGQAQLVDSTWTDGVSMGARRRVSLQPQRDIRLEYAGRRVRGTIGPNGTPGAPIDTSLAAPMFEASSWDLIARAMPLAVGYAAQFRVYDLETGSRLYQVRVTGTTTVAGEPAFVVLLRLGGPREITVWIGTTSRRLLQVETPIDDTTFLQQTLQRTSPRSRAPARE